MTWQYGWLSSHWHLPVASSGDDGDDGGGGGDGGDGVGVGTAGGDDRLIDGLSAGCVSHVPLHAAESQWGDIEDW